MRHISLYGSLALAAWFGAVHVYPAVSEAWKLHLITAAVAKDSSGKTRKEVLALLDQELKARNIVTVTKHDMSIERDGNQWVIGADYMFLDQLVPRVSLAYEFSVASNKEGFRPSLE